MKTSASQKRKRRSGQFKIVCPQYKKSREKLMILGPLPKTTTPFPKVANVVTTFKPFEETETKKRNRENRRLKQTKSYRTSNTIKDKTFDLVSIVRQLPAAKLDLSGFGTLVCRMVDQATALIFKSGNVVTVRSLSPAGGIWTCHAYAHLLNGMKQLYMPDGTDFSDWYPGCGYLPATPVMTTLKGRLRLLECWRENIVGHGYLGTKINLAEMAIENPHVTRYEPASFPGLQWKASIKDQKTGERKTIKNLIFSSGMWLIIGALHMRTVNEVFFQLRKVADQFKDIRPEVPKKQRNKFRLNSLWTQRFQPILNSGDEDADVPHAFKEKSTKLSIPVKSLSEQIQNITARINLENKKQFEAETIRRAKKMKVKNKQHTDLKDARVIETLTKQEDEKGYSLLMKAVDRGQYDNVDMLLESGEDPSETTKSGVSALDLLDGKEEEVYMRIRVLLLQHLIPKEDHNEAIGFDNLQENF